MKLSSPSLKACPRFSMVDESTAYGVTLYTYTQHAAVLNSKMESIDQSINPFQASPESSDRQRPRQARGKEQ